ncbi:MAG: hypothetical protein Q9170_005968 [Blastenia crenularia]
MTSLVVIDTACPWCYVGKTKLDRAISPYKSTDTFSTTWYPFYIEPDAPKVSVDKRQYYKDQFGAGRAPAMFDRLVSIGNTGGLEFKFGGKKGNTRDSHRLIQLAKTKGSEVQTRVVQELFASYFEKGEDIISHDILKTAAVRAGMEEAEVKNWLASDNGMKEVDQQVVEAQKKGVRNVPKFTLQGKHGIEGAQDPEE